MQSKSILKYFSTIDLPFILGFIDQILIVTEFKPFFVHAFMGIALFWIMSNERKQFFSYFSAYFCTHICFFFFSYYKVFKNIFLSKTPIISILYYIFILITYLGSSLLFKDLLFFFFFIISLRRITKKHKDNKNLYSIITFKLLFFLLINEIIKFILIIFITNKSYFFNIINPSINITSSIKSNLIAINFAKIFMYNICVAKIKSMLYFFHLQRANVLYIIREGFTNMDDMESILFTKIDIRIINLFILSMIFFICNITFFNDNFAGAIWLTIHSIFFGYITLVGDNILLFEALFDESSRFIFIVTYIVMSTLYAKSYIFHFITMDLIPIIFFTYKFFKKLFFFKKENDNSINTY